MAQKIKRGLFKMLPLSMVALMVMALAVGMWGNIPTQIAEAGDGSMTFNSAALTLQNDADSNSIANIGDTIRLVVDFTNTDANCAGAGSGATADFSAYGGGATRAPDTCTDNGGSFDGLLQWDYVIVDAGGSGIDVAANDASSAINVTLADNDEDGIGNATGTSNNLGAGADAAGATNGVDTIAPVVNDSDISILSTGSGTGGIYIAGDTVTAQWDNSVANVDTITSITFDLSAFGGSATATAYDDGSTCSDSTGADDIWTSCYTLIAGAIDSASLNASVSATDNAGNTTTTADTTNLSVDTQDPVVTDGNISIAGATGTGGAYKIGNTVTVTWDAATDGTTDVASATADLSGFGGGAAVAMTDTTACGGTAANNVWEACYTIVAGIVDGTNINATVSVTDNAGNSTGPVADTTNATVDSIAPTVTDGNIAISGATGTGGAYKIGDTVTVTWESAEEADSPTATADLSGFGGGAAVAMTDTGCGGAADTVLEACYTIVAGIIDGTGINASVTATDNAGNTTTTADTTNATVDNIAPTVTAANISVTGANGTAGAFKNGDTAVPTWNNTAGGDNNSDTIASVSFDASNFRTGDTGLAGSDAAGTWTASLSGAMTSQDDTNNNVSVTAVDNAGNSTTTAGTNNYVIDTIVPTVTAGNVNISAGCTGTAGACKNGDTPTLQWDGNTDSETDTIASASFNGASLKASDTARAGANQGSNVWEASLSGAMDSQDDTGNTITVTVIDNAGNSTGPITSTATYTVDTIVPTLTAGNITVTGATGTSGAFKFGDTAVPTWNNTGGGDANTDTIASVSFNAANFRAGDTALVGSDSSGTWTASLSGAMDAQDDAGNTITATVTDNAGNVSGPTTSSTGYTIDTIVPGAPATPDMQAASDTGSSSTDNITNDTTPTFDVTAGEAGSTLNLVSSVNGAIGSRTGTGAITASTLTGGAGTAHNITVVETDDAGNVSSASSALGITVDTSAPSAPGTPDMTSGTDSGTSSSDNVTNDTTPTFDISSVETGATVNLISSVDGGVGTGAEAGNASTITSSALTGSTGGTAHNITATQTDVAGNTSVASSALSSIIDTGAAAPNAPDLQAASDTGLSSTDDYTNSTTPTFDISGLETSATVALTSSVDGVVGGGAESGGGAASVAAAGLTGGNPQAHTMTVTQTDIAGNTSAASAGLAIDVDTAVPVFNAVDMYDVDTDGRADEFHLGFSEAVDDSTITLGDWSLGGTAADTDLSTTSTNGGDTNTANDANFTLSVAAGVAGTEAKAVDYVQGTLADIAGNLLATSSIGAGVTSDLAGPVKLSSTPANGATNVSAGSIVSVTFSEAMNTAVGSFSDDNTDSFNVPSWTNGDKTVNVTHSNWTANVSVTVTLTSFAAAAGAPTALQGSDNFTFQTGTPGGGGGGASLPPSAQGSISINGGAAKTAVREVAIDLNYTNASEYIISESSSLADGTWKPVTGSVSFTLSDGEGTKTVFGAFRGSGGTSGIAQDSIVYEKTATVEETKPVEKTKPKVEVDDSQLVRKDPEPAEPLPETVRVGELVKSASSSAVYFLDQDNRRHAFPNATVYSSWFKDFSNVRTIDDATLAAIPLGSNVIMRAGTYLIKIQSENKVYAVEPYGVIRWLETEDVAKALYGDNWASDVRDVDVTFFINYQEGTSVNENVHPEESVIQYAGETLPYIIQDGKKRPIMGDTFAADLFRDEFVQKNIDTSISYPTGDNYPVLPAETLMKLK